MSFVRRKAEKITIMDHVEKYFVILSSAASLLHKFLSVFLESLENKMTGQ